MASWKQKLPGLCWREVKLENAYFFFFSKAIVQISDCNIKNKEIFYQWLYRTVKHYFYNFLFDVLQAALGKSNFNKTANVLEYRNRLFL